ncbi:MAG: hypothetical protein GX548_00500 [Lentisphaerae bacterium]|nr:hypothetical protein [Lentisphaerota bacterium]
MPLDPLTDGEGRAVEIQRLGAGVGEAGIGVGGSPVLGFDAPGKAVDGPGPILPGDGRFGGLHQKVGIVGPSVQSLPGHIFRPIEFAVLSESACQTGQHLRIRSGGFMANLLEQPNGVAPLPGLHGQFGMDLSGGRFSVGRGGEVGESAGFGRIAGTGAGQGQVRTGRQRKMNPGCGDAQRLQLGADFMDVHAGDHDPVERHG